MRSLAGLLGASASVFLSACGSGGGGGGGGGGGTPPPAEVVLFVSDAPSDDLIRLQGSANSLVLFDDSGGSTDNFLASALYPINLVSLDLEAVPVASVQVPPGQYVSAFLSLSAPTLSARTKDPTLGDVPITSLPAVSASFLSPLDLKSGDLVGIVLDIDLVRSTFFDVGTGSLVFLPSQRPMILSAGAPVALFEGIVRKLRASQKIVEVDVVPPDADMPLLGPIEFEIENTDLLLGPGGSPLSGTSAFFGAVEIGDRVAASGVWNPAGFVDASFARIETGSGVVVEIEGPLLLVNPPLQSFTLQIATVRTGASLVDAELAPLGDPGAVNVTWDGLTSFSLLEPPGASSPGALLVGQEVRVRFDSFSVVGPPATVSAPAAAVEILDTAEIFEGVVTDTASLPASMVVTLDPTDPHVLGFLVSGPISFELGGISPPRLLVDEGFALTVNDFLPGQRVHFLGTLTGAAPSQTVVADSADILPGRISDSTVTSVNPSTARFLCTFDTMTEPVDPFGGAPPTSPAMVQIEPGALLLNPLGNPIGLQEFANLSAQFGMNLHADFQGVAAPVGGLLRAFDVRLTTQ
jgi:hypothetical protein